MCLQFGFVIFWQKDFGAKAANKMLAKLTPVANRKRVQQNRTRKRTLRARAKI